MPLQVIRRGEPGIWRGDRVFSEHAAARKQRSGKRRTRHWSYSYSDQVVLPALKEKGENRSSPPSVGLPMEMGFLLKLCWVDSFKKYRLPSQGASTLKLRV